MTFLLAFDGHFLLILLVYVPLFVDPGPRIKQENKLALVIMFNLLFFHRYFNDIFLKQINKKSIQKYINPNYGFKLSFSKQLVEM